MWGSSPHALCCLKKILAAGVMQNIEGLVNAEAQKIHFVELAGEKSEVLEHVP